MPAASRETQEKCDFLLPTFSLLGLLNTISPRGMPVNLNDSWEKSFPNIFRQQTMKPIIQWELTQCQALQEALFIFSLILTQA